jgi:photosystem II stability/assembly factor-like uncharacterized protein
LTGFEDFFNEQRRGKGFLESLEPTGPFMSLKVTSDNGATWRVVYTGPPGVTQGERFQGPLEIPITFADTDHGFGVQGDPPTDSILPGGADYFYTADGGITWTPESPPIPGATAACSTASCIYASPVLSGPDQRRPSCNCRFRVAGDGGVRLDVRRRFAVGARIARDRRGGTERDAVAWERRISARFASPSAWWVLGWSPHGVTTEVSADSGASWSRATYAIGRGVPTGFVALNATHALLSLESTSPNGATYELLETDNGGRTWGSLSLKP